jgi:hypothetical protein
MSILELAIFSKHFEIGTVSVNGGATFYTKYIYSFLLILRNQKLTVSMLRMVERTNLVSLLSPSQMPGISSI